MAEKQDDDKPRQLPEQYRASLDPKDEAAHARLLANDAEQAERAKRFDTGSMPASPREVMRSKAAVQIETLMTAAKHQTLIAGQIDQLAECYAAVGEYDKAAHLYEPGDARRETYEKYWAAVWLPDEKWCDDDASHKYVKEYIWSVKENREMPMLACNSCAGWNVVDMPRDLADRKNERDRNKGQTKGMDIAGALQWHKQNIRTQP